MSVTSLAVLRVYAQKAMPNRRDGILDDRFDCLLLGLGVSSLKLVAAVIQDAPFDS